MLNHMHLCNHLSSIKNKYISIWLGHISWILELAYVALFEPSKSPCNAVFECHKGWQNSPIAAYLVEFALI